MSLTLRSIVAAATAAALTLGSPVSAIALMEAEVIKGTSTYNPNVGDGAFWRWNWGNVLDPDVTFTTFPGDTVEELVGMGYLGARPETNQTTGYIYEMRQLDTGGNGFVAPTLGTSDRTGRIIDEVFQQELKTFLVGSFDVRSVVDRHGWTAAPYLSKTGEGLYGVQVRFHNQFRTEAATVTPLARRMAFGVDLTAPGSVSDLTSNAQSLVNANGWTEARWRNMSWRAPTSHSDNYDSLSGVGRFIATIDGEDTASVHNCAPQPGFEPYAHLINPMGSAVPIEPQVSNMTIENIPGGAHKIGVITVDRATNRSVPAIVDAKVDYDTPRAEFVWTAASRPAWRLARTDSVSVVASDSAGISSVDFYLDSEFIGTGRAQTGGVWTLKRDFSEFSSGKHQLTAVVKDMIGGAPGAWRVPHVITLNPQTVTVDKTAPRASVKASAKGRTITIKTTQVSEAAAMKVSIDSKTVESASLKSSGSQTVKHSVPQREVTRQTRRVKWSVRLTDSVGNARTYSGYVSVRYWDLVKRGGRSVQLVIY